MSKNNKKRVYSKPEVEQPVEQPVEKETIIIEPELLKAEAPEVTEEPVCEIEPTFIPSFEAVPFEEEAIPPLEGDAGDLTLHATEPCVCTEPCTEPCDCTPMLSPELKDVIKDKPDVYDYVTPELHVEGDKVPEELEKFHNVDAVAELEKILEEDMENRIEELKQLPDVQPEVFEVEPEVVQVKKPRTLAELSSLELRHFQRTGQMTKE